MAASSSLVPRAMTRRVAGMLMGLRRD